MKHSCKTKKLTIILIASLLIALFFMLDLKRYLTIESLKANRAAIEAYHATHRLETVAVFMAAFIIQSALALPGPLIMCLAAGVIFGVTMGTIYITVAATIGATLAFLATRYLFRDSIQKRFGTRLIRVNEFLAKEGFASLLFIRLIPVIPFTLINIGAGMTSMPLGTFVLATLVGIIPPGLIFCNAGANLATLSSASDLLSLRMVLSLSLMGVFPLLALILRRRIEKKGTKY